MNFGRRDAEKIWKTASAAAAKTEAAPSETTFTDASGEEWRIFGAASARFAPQGADLLARAIRACGADALYADDLLNDGEAGVLRLKPVWDQLFAAECDYIGAVAVRSGVFCDKNHILPGDFGDMASFLRSRPDVRVAHLPYPAFIHDQAPDARPTPGAPLSDRTTPDAGIAVVIPNRDSPDLIREACAGVLRRTSAEIAELVIVDNGSEDPRTLALYEELRADPRVVVDIRNERFNFAAMINRGVALTTAKTILLLNNDIEVIEPGWITEMSRVLAQPRIGVVGAKLLYPDRTIQHAGVLVGHGGVAGHDMKGMDEYAMDPLGRMKHPHLRSAVTAAAMLVRREVWDLLGAMDARRFPVAFNDVDFCLRAGEAGWSSALAPSARLIHHESVSRRGPFRLRRFLEHQSERTALRLRHGTLKRNDRFESPWRDLDDLTPNLRLLRAPPRVRI